MPSLWFSTTNEGIFWPVVNEGDYGGTVSLLRPPKREIIDLPHVRILGSLLTNLHL